ncbi:sugar phosphate isomerase/epimerase family protein [Ideonella livida]|uniref:Sugar phosphate isomerase/epimerase n=1 Tax=Ideonella livida TaxID=2707176 RepID=A0A7C9PH50_9BURK|nr:sugar phosphate isomerase/epimerase [Ideonella livida]NDY91251.1 sugar phosphate isomerase/epimerase [Ideonella livida]
MISTPRTLSLAQLIALPYNPPQMVALAAATGCTGVGLRLLPTAPGGRHYPLMDAPALLAETLAALADTGVQVMDLEVVRLGEAFDVTAFLPLFDVGQRLGARHLLVAGDDPDEARLTAAFATLCEAAAPYGLTADLEFMPWTAVPNVSTAARIVAAVAQPNAGLLVDALHFARSASTLAEVAALPRAWLHYAQVCDGRVPPPTTVEGLIFDARCERLLPGEGGIDLPGLLAALPADLPLSIEVPSERRAPAMGYTAWAAAAKAATLRLLGG